MGSGGQIEPLQLPTHLPFKCKQSQLLASFVLNTHTHTKAGAGRVCPEVVEVMVVTGWYHCNYFWVGGEAAGWMCSWQHILQVTPAAQVWS